MAQFKSYIQYLCYTMITISLVSCGTNHADVQYPSQIANSININFQENVLNLNPLKASSTSETFIAGLVYDRLINNDGTSKVIKDINYDSLLSIHFFTLFSGRKFHDDSELNTNSIKLLLKYLFEFRFYEKSVQQLFYALSGSGSVNWYRQNHNILDSIPFGFQIHNDSIFSIKLEQKNHLLLQWLQSPVFTLFKVSENKFVGSGNYELQTLDEDISAQLKRVSNSNAKIEHINISFIKNQEVVLSEFLSGSLDLFVYNPNQTHTFAKNKQIKKILMDKYSQYQVTIANNAIVRYAVINNLSDSLLIKHIEKSAVTRIDITKNQVNKAIINIIDKTLSDSLILEIPWISEVNLNGKEYFKPSRHIRYIETNSEKLNPSEPHIVIMETNVNYTWSKKEILNNLAQLENASDQKISRLIELERFYTYVIYNNKLKGIRKYQNLSTMVNNMYYMPPKAY